MDVDQPVTPADAHAADDFARALDLQRQRMQQFLVAQRERMEQVGAELAERAFRVHEALEERHAELVRRESLFEAAAEARPQRGQPIAQPEAPTGDLMYNRGSSWAEEKLRIMAALEAEGHPSDGHRAAERVRIEEVLRITEAALAEKDRELAELRELVAAQSTGDSVILDPAARRKVLDEDSLIREERENLKQLQAHWEGMLRTAEIELSQERARLARERAELEEKLRAQHSESAASGTPGGESKSARGRWLARLGFKDEADSK